MSRGLPPELFPVSRVVALEFQVLLRRLRVAGMITVFFTYPLELIRVRMAFQTRNSNPSSPFKGTDRKSVV